MGGPSFFCDFVFDAFPRRPAYIPFIPTIEPGTSFRPDGIFTRIGLPH